MAKKKYFLGSVGTVEAFHKVDGRLELAFRSKTLTDSGINISTVKDDIRAGTGAPVQFSFYHDTSAEITLTDVLFDESYVAAQLGAQFVTGGLAYTSEDKATGDGETSITLDKDPESLVLGCGGSETLVWYSVVGEDDWKRVEDENLNGKVVSGLQENKAYCFRYVARDSDVKIAEITSEIIPEELFLIVTAPVFSGDACSASNGKKAGTITYEVPRFKLNGAQDFTMNMSSNQTMSLSGTALASESGCEITGSKLLRIIVKYNDLHWYDEAERLVSDESFEASTDEPHIYAIYKNGTASLIDNEELTFTPALTGGKWGATGSFTVKATEKPELETSVTIAE